MIKYILPAFPAFLISFTQLRKELINSHSHIARITESTDISLKASPLTAVAKTPVRNNPHMTEFSASKIHALILPAAIENCTAYTVLQRQAHEIT